VGRSTRGRKLTESGLSQ